MANSNIGVIACPLCGLDADVRSSKKDKAYIVCSDCGLQAFARGFTANKLLMEKMRPVAPPMDNLPIITVKPSGVAEKVPVITVKPAPVRRPASVPPAIHAAPMAKELTIFDGAFWKGGDND